MEIFNETNFSSILPYKMLVQYIPLVGIIAAIVIIYLCERLNIL